MNNIVIVGAGPAGLQTAMRLREEGFDPLVIEEHEKVGVPEHCSGLISRKGIEDLGLSVEGSLLNEIKGAKIFSPNGTALEIKRNKTVAYVVSRKDFDLELLKKARAKNIHVAMHTKLIDAKKSITGKEMTLFVQVEGRGEMRRTQFVVGADGANSTVRHLMGINPSKENFVHTMQATCSGSFDEKMVEMHLSPHAKGFFGWMVPLSNEKAKIGIGSILGDNVHDAFNSFLKEKFPNARAAEAKSALIPYGAPLASPAKESYALVGDAAFQVKATSGGGVIFGMKAGNILGQAIAGALTKKGQLHDYEKMLSPLYKELRMHWKLRRYANSLSNPQIDDLFMKLKEKGLEGFLEKEGDMDEPSKFIGKLAMKPAYWFMAKTLLDIARS